MDRAPLPGPGPGRTRAWIGLGANLGDAAASVRAAIDALDALPGTRRVEASRLYRTPAWGRTDQPDFINAVAALDTALGPQALLAALLGLERAAGRVRDPAERWGPRALDLDLLLHGDAVLDLPAGDGPAGALPALQLPHPQMHLRAFVLAPLAELAPGLVLPGHGRADVLLGALDAGGIEALP
jgi:2-amino-4-hydroxy-6-hydroxymethyldihydropteridine diphosphokinase